MKVTTKSSMNTYSSKNKKILFITLHRKDRSPGQRFRFEQYLEFLESQGYEITFSNLLSEWDDQAYYQPGNYLTKAWIASKSWWKRYQDTLKASQFDIIFIYREAYFIGTTFFEKQLKKSGAKIVFDFDDAIWYRDVSAGNKRLAFLKDPDKTEKLIRLSDLIFAGNEYLAHYARQYNDQVWVIPTTIDTDHLHNRLVEHENKDLITIGWTGSRTTLKFLTPLYLTLKKIQELYPIRLLVICDVAPPKFDGIHIDYLPWKLDTEIDDLLQMDIGIMPLPNNKWSQGKCGFKILQYLALGIPAIASPIGVNTDIIEEGQNGFLATNESEWIDALSKLIENPQLRTKMGLAGRKTIENRYSVKAIRDQYLQAFNNLLNLNPENVVKK